jgi:hypothetical protein
MLEPDVLQGGFWCIYMVHLEGDMGGEMTPDSSITIICVCILDVMAKTLYFGKAFSFLTKFTIIPPYCEICFFLSLNINLGREKITRTKLRI